jgi:hypothetical protein
MASNVTLRNPCEVMVLRGVVGRYFVKGKATCKVSKILLSSFCYFYNQTQRFFNYVKIHNVVLLNGKYTLKLLY